MSGPPRLMWAAGAKLGEAALWDDRIACLWWVDVQSRRLYRMNEAGGERASWDLPHVPGHVALTDDPERLILGLQPGHFLFEPRQGRLEALAVPQGHSPRHRLNDGKVDAAGRLWFGTMHEAEQEAEGALHWLDPGSEATRVAGPFTIPNGPAFTADGAVMYLADSPARVVLAFDMEAGRPIRRREFLRLKEDAGFPDGMTVDAEGGLWVAHWDGSRVSQFNPDGSLACSIRLPVAQVTSCTFGGADLHTLFVTTAGGSGHPGGGPAGGVFAIRTKACGLRAGRI
ncbi:MAG: Sugar lactone lactonase YvrE, partial [Belnapia sp.]|nr:Sugar lactone lactonase YvrE [Belnapia sp.]